MLQYRFDQQANRIYTEITDRADDQQRANHLHDLLPRTKPGFTVLFDVSDLSPSEIPALIHQDEQVLFVDYGIRRCAYLSRDTHVLFELNKQVRKLHFKIDRGYFTRRDDALHFLTDESVN